MKLSKIGVWKSNKNYKKNKKNILNISKNCFKIGKMIYNKEV